MNHELPQQPEESIESLLELYGKIKKDIEHTNRKIAKYDELHQRAIELKTELDALVESGAGVKEYASSMDEPVDEPVFSRLDMRHKDKLIGINLVVKKRNELYMDRDQYRQAVTSVAIAEEALENVKKHLIEKGVPEVEIG